MRFLLSLLFIGRIALCSGQCELLCNVDFEDHPVNPGSYSLVPQDEYPCWRTTATDGMIEVWGTGFDGVPAYSGLRFIELNANQPSGLYQDFTAQPGTTVTISFAHRARVGPQDVMSVEIGRDNVFEMVEGNVSDGLSWGYHTYNYTLPTGGGTTFTVRFSAVSTGTGDLTVGNFLDHISIALPGPTLVVQGISPICGGGTDGQALATVTGGPPPYTFSWTPTGATTAIITGLSVGSYVCTVTDANGCSTSATVTLLDPDPVLAFGSDTITCPGTTVELQASATGGAGSYTYAWTPQGPSVAPQVPTTYFVTATDANGCTSAPAAVDVEVRSAGECALIIPNVFSPNNDGKNDRFVIQGLNGRPNRVIVRNRWGQVVLDANNYRNQWTGADVTDGTYFYEVTVEGLPQVLTGHLTILGGK